MRRSTAALGLEDFEQLRHMLNAHAGLWFGADARPVVERRLRERLAAVGLSSFADYRKRLADGDVAELEEAVEACTVNETYAFRGANQLRAFRDDLLPRLAPRGRVTIWSAGCATGEEAYTIAAVVLASGLFPASKVRVFGTDISRRCIAAARRGVYSASSFRGETDDLLDRYFQKNADGTRTVVDSLREVCVFRHSNLLRSHGGGSVDVIFCRNVLIHFDDAARRRAVGAFFDRLAPGGYLVLGHSESLLHQSTPFVPLELSEDIVYRKPSIDELLGSGRAP